MYKDDRLCRNWSYKNTSDNLQKYEEMFLNDKMSCAWSNNMSLVCGNLVDTKIVQLQT